MTRKRAIRWLYGRHRREWDFGWHDPRPAVRKWYRDLYPVEYVAAYFRDDLTTGQRLMHRLRLEGLHRRAANA